MVPRAILRDPYEGTSYDPEYVASNTERDGEEEP